MVCRYTRRTSYRHQTTPFTRSQASAGPSDPCDLTTEGMGARAALIQRTMPDPEEDYLTQPGTNPTPRFYRGPFIKGDQWRFRPEMPASIPFGLALQPALRQAQGEQFHSVHGELVEPQGGLGKALSRFEQGQRNFALSLVLPAHFDPHAALDVPCRVLDAYDVGHDAEAFVQIDVANRVGP